MSLGLLGGYDTDSGSDETEQAPLSAVNDSHGALSINKAVAGREGGAITTNVQESACVSPNAAKEGASEDQVGGGSPHAACYGLSGEGELIDSDDSGSLTSDEDGGGCETSGAIREKSPLPVPELDGSYKLTSSVFSNPYREAEEAKLAVLKQHVDLSQSAEPRKERRKWPSKRGKRKRSQFQPGDAESGNQCWNDRDSPIGAGGWKQQGKHRSGVREDLEPPKKYMKTHLKIQSQERPWTAR